MKRLMLGLVGLAVSMATSARAERVAAYCDVPAGEVITLPCDDVLTVLGSQFPFHHEGAGQKIFILSIRVVGEQDARVLLRLFRRLPGPCRPPILLSIVRPESPARVSLEMLGSVTIDGEIVSAEAQRVYVEMDVDVRIHFR